MMHDDDSRASAKKEKKRRCTAGLDGTAPEIGIYLSSSLVLLSTDVLLSPNPNPTYIRA
jgi:hypothetical protein